MSAPKTNLEKQKKRHRFPLMGLRAVAFWSIGLLGLLALFVILTGDGPEGADEVVDGRTGAVTEVEEGVLAE